MMMVTADLAVTVTVHLSNVFGSAIAIARVLALHIELLAEVVADLDQHGDAFGKARLGDVAWSAPARNSQLSSVRRTEITIPSGQSAWTFSP
jgi:hypothetical protein